jgi:uncharacterized protein YigA (DUF484 family)
MSQTQSALAGDEVAAWLRGHPQFLQQYPDLALSLVVPREDGQAASLVGLHELATTAQVNEQLAVRTHQLTLALMRQTNPADTLRATVAALAEDFAGDQVALVLLAPVDGLGDAPWLRVLREGDARLGLFTQMLVAGEPVCGRLSPKRNVLLYGEAAAQVQSSAVLPLPGIGLLAVGSADPNRFWPGIGTVFLDMMAQSVTTALARFD